VIAALAAAILAVSSALGPSGAAAAAARAGADPAGAAIALTVGPQSVGRPIPPAFIGFSIEYTSAPAYFGDPSAPNPTFIQLVRNLTPGQRPVLRFGGDTADWTWWPTPGVARPPGIRYTLSPAWAAATRATARALDARLILGINLEADRAAIAATESRQLLARIGQRYVHAFELGNEPEVYGSLGWYTSPSGASVPGRPRGYDFNAYLRDYASMRAALPSRVPLAGPASGAPVWLANLGRFLQANPRVRVATFHRYPLYRCFTGPASPHFPTIPHLFAPAASSGLAASLASAVRAAHAQGRGFRVDELNSVSCGGSLGVSDRFAAALWLLDTLFAMARTGVDGVNIHTFRIADYAPFTFSHSSTGWTAQVKAPYYGLLAFTRAAPPGSRLLRVYGRRPASARVWATRDTGGAVRVTLINESLDRPASFFVRAPHDVAPAALTRLSAPSASAADGISLGGQTFASPTATGLPTGAPAVEPVIPRRGGYLVRLPGAGAALLRIPG
jgi:hypothetical protein